MHNLTENQINEKYSLRQRGKRRGKCNKFNAAGNNDNNNITMTENYRTKRACLAPATTTNSVTTKTKTKAAPLSKYRRKTANARERTRMREINTAFEQLRYCVPPTIVGEDANCNNEKLTKITTLRLAMKYIQTLSQALEDPEAETALLQELEMAGDMRFTNNAQIPHQLDYVDAVNKVENSDAVESSKKATKLKQSKQSNKKCTTKRATKKQRATKVLKKIKSRVTNMAHSPASSSSSSSAYSSLYSNVSIASDASNASHSSTIYDMNSLELNNLLLESDGESLNLSENCLSPLAVNNGQLFPTFDSPLTNFSTLENPLELSLRLFDTAVTDQTQPSSCINSLSNLDSLTPFCDLLAGTDFPEQQSLDMFLT